MKPRSKRPKAEPRRILLSGERQREEAMKALRAAPLDAVRPLEFLIREEVKKRGLDQNALMWAGPMRDIAEQCRPDGQQFRPETWAEQFKIEFLPEEFDPELCREGYQKWDYTPSGDRVLIGSTTMLTVKGMALHIEQIHAFGANMGVRFHANPNEVPMLREVPL